MRTTQLSSSPRSWQSAGLRLTSVGPPELAASRAAWRREEAKAPSPGLAQGALGENIGVDRLMRQRLRRRQFASNEPRFKPDWQALLRSPNGSACVHAHTKRNDLPNRWDAWVGGGSGLCYARRAPVPLDGERGPRRRSCVWSCVWMHPNTRPNTSATQYR